MVQRYETLSRHTIRLSPNTYDATELLADFIESNPIAHTLRNMYFINKQVDIYSLAKL